MNIYFAGSIRGGRDDVQIYGMILEILSKHGKVLTEHIGDTTISAKGEWTKDPRDVYQRDVDWINGSNVIVAEVSTPSLGVGYEIGKAESLGKKILCLHHLEDENQLSAMIKGNKNLDVKKYRGATDLKEIIDYYFEQLS